MALISCSECGKQISDRARTCPNCGCPIISSCGTVKIKVPQNQYYTPLEPKGVTIINNETNELLWNGRQGQIAVFEIQKPTSITIKTNKATKDIITIVYAGKNYSCTMDNGVHWHTTYNISEVDSIDSEI